jgi:uncharacterized glyoxalase superfamily protein PhnB
MSLSRRCGHPSECILAPAAVSVVCVFCKGVDALHDDLVARGANITRETMTHPYGMRDFIVTDPDGHQLIFGQGTSEQ